MWEIHGQNRKRTPKITTAIASVLAITTVVFSYPAEVSAAGGTILPVEVFGKDVVSVGIPVVPEGEKSPFDFILDPQGLIYETDAMRYGGGTVEEGATLLFHNNEGGYNFSRYSDRLTVTNQSTVPVTVTISAYVSNLEGVALSGSDDFTGDEAQSIYLALVDGVGNVQPILAGGETSFSWVMQAAPENAYVYTINEEDQTYDCVLSGNPGEIGFDTYSFGLIGACNPNAEWKDMAIHPVVTVVWHVDPILPEQEEPLDEETDGEKDKEADEDKEMDKEADKDLEGDIDKALEILQKDPDAQGSVSEEKPAGEDESLTETPGSDSADHTNEGTTGSITDKNSDNKNDKTTGDTGADVTENRTDESGNDKSGNDKSGGDKSGESTGNTANEGADNGAGSTRQNPGVNSGDNSVDNPGGEPADSATGSQEDQLSDNPAVDEAQGNLK